MKSSINLVSKRVRPSQFHKRLFAISLVIFSVVFLFSVGLIGFKLFLENQLAQLKSQEASLIAAVNQDPEKKIKFLTVRERLSEIQKIINTRKNLNNRIESVGSILPPDVGIGLVEGDEDKVRLRVQAEDLVSLNNLIEQRVQEYALERNRGVKRIEMTSFKLNPSSLLYEADFIIEFI